MSDNVVKPGPGFDKSEGWMLIIGFIIVSITFAAFVFGMQASKSEIALPMLAIAGLVLLIVCLTGVAYVFARLGMSDRDQALGLPTGSVQAVIALSLVVLFAILSIFLFTAMTGTRELRNLSEAQRVEQANRLGAAVQGWEPTGKEGTTQLFTLYISDSANAARNDVGKQLIVLIGTLMTSAVSFYFGSRSAAQAVLDKAAIDQRTRESDADRSPGNASTRPSISKVDVATITRGQPADFVVSGTGLGIATTVEVRQAGKSFPVKVVTISDTSVRFSLTLPETATNGSYDVVVIKDGKELVTKTVSLTMG